MKRACVFCKIRDKKLPAQVIRETDDLMVIKDIVPKAPTHYLIISRKHIKDIATYHRDMARITGQMVVMAQKLARQLPQPPYFRLIFNNGLGAGQTVFHLHAHFLSGKKMSDL